MLPDHFLHDRKLLFCLADLYVHIGSHEKAAATRYSRLTAAVRARNRRSKKPPFRSSRQQSTNRRGRSR